MFHLQDLYSGDQNLFRFLIGLDSISTLVLLDRDGNIVDFNAKFLSRGDFHPGDILGKSLRTLMNSDFQDESFWTEFQKTVESAGVWRGQLNGLFKEKSIWLDAMACTNPTGEGTLILLFDSQGSKETRNLEPVMRDIVHSLNNWISVIFATADMMNHKVSQIEDELDPSTIEFFKRRIENLETSINNGNLKIQQIRKLL
jgi:hypothetical protein